jgi:hypothetical protein
MVVLSLTFVVYIHVYWKYWKSVRRSEPYVLPLGCYV